MKRPILNPLGISRWEGNKYTHKKRTYYARCVQYKKGDEVHIIDILEKYCTLEQHKDGLTIRWNDPKHIPSLEHITEGVWIRVGENGTIKIMPDDEFKLKYEELK